MRLNRASLYRVLFNLLPSGNSSLYSLFNQYVCRYNGEGNGDIETKRRFNK